MVIWVKGDTKILLSLDGSGHGLPRSELGRIIDSFRPVYYRNLPIQYVDKSKI